MANSDPTASGYPELSDCRWCGKVIRRNAPGSPWALRGPWGDNPQCDKAPNPEDGPMPRHAPGSAILSPPPEGRWP